MESDVCYVSNTWVTFTTCPHVTCCVFTEISQGGNLLPGDQTAHQQSRQVCVILMCGVWVWRCDSRCPGVITCATGVTCRLVLHVTEVSTLLSAHSSCETCAPRVVVTPVLHYVTSATLCHVVTAGPARTVAGSCCSCCASQWHLSESSTTRCSALSTDQNIRKHGAAPTCWRTRKCEDSFQFSLSFPRMAVYNILNAQTFQNVSKI